jgi:hypothetical protein
VLTSPFNFDLFERFFGSSTQPHPDGLSGAKKSLLYYYDFLCAGLGTTDTGSSILEAGE